MNFNEYQNVAHTTAQYPDLIDLLSNIMKTQDSSINLSEEIKNTFKNVVNSKDASSVEKDLCMRYINWFFMNHYYPSLGLAGEVGEYCNKLKKVMRDKSGIIDSEFKEYAIGELGDILWYLAESASSLGISLDDIATKNIEKLLSRKERGVIQGNGDNR